MLIFKQNYRQTVKDTEKAKALNVAVPTYLTENV